MDIKDIAALVQIRNYAFSVREDRNVFKGSDYQKITSKIARIDKFLSTVLTEEDLVSMVLSPKIDVPQSVPEETNLKKVSKVSKKNSKKTDVVSNVSDSQISLKYGSSDDMDDEALLAKRISEEKEKLASRAKKVSK